MVNKLQRGIHLNYEKIWLIQTMPNFFLMKGVLKCHPMNSSRDSEPLWQLCMTILWKNYSSQRLCHVNVPFLFDPYLFPQNFGFTL